MMTRRKGEITGGDLKRNWRRRVALPAEEVRDLSTERIFCVAGVLSATPSTYSLRRVAASTTAGKRRRTRPERTHAVGRHVGIARHHASQSWRHSSSSRVICYTPRSLQRLPKTEPFLVILRTMNKHAPPCRCGNFSCIGLD
jgi:hypothetical protein